MEEIKREFAPIGTHDAIKSLLGKLVGEKIITEDEKKKIAEHLAEHFKDIKFLVIGPRKINDFVDSAVKKIKGLLRSNDFKDYKDTFGRSKQMMAVIIFLRSLEREE